MNETDNFEDLSNLQRYLPQWVWVYYFAFAQIFRDIVDHLMLASFAASNVLLLYLILGAIVYIYLVKYGLLNNKLEVAKKRVLFVIAHPDDECMFFGPTILRLRNCNEVYLLCLSTGNHYKQGSVRKEELYKSCKSFGIPQSNIMVMNNSRMPDDPDFIWNARRTARILVDHIESLSIEEVYTFDIGGVSGHLNHISIFYGFARLCLSGNLPSGLRVFLLDSVNPLRKYSVFFDAALSAFPLSTLPLRQRLFVVPLIDSCIVREAMRQHQSQMVWYRTAYIYLSRYMYINTYKELEIEDLTLVLQMTDYNPLL